MISRDEPTVDPPPRGEANGGDGAGRPGRLARAAGVVLVAPIVLVWLACANIEAPSGGPVDDTEPEVLATYPDSGSVDVPSVDSLALVFSEKMDRRSVEESFVITPEVDFGKRRWTDEEGRTVWSIQLREPLQEGRTYVGFLGAETADRRKNTFGRGWSYVFATGPLIDPGSVSGRVVGQRFSPKNAFLYVYPWDSAPPDTTEESYPRPPERLGQTDEKGEFTVGYLSLERDLRLCVLFDREKDGRFQPGIDRWVCWPDPIAFDDTTQALTDLEIYIADDDEPGTLAGTAGDSLCLRADYRDTLQRVRASRDSLLQWQEGQASTETRGFAGVTFADSVRIERELATLAEEEAGAHEDSLYCAQPVVVTVETSEGEVIRKQSGRAEFKWTDVPTGIYRIRAFRDVDQDGQMGETEPRGRYPFPVEMRPLRVLDELNIKLLPPESPSETNPGTEP